MSSWNQMSLPIYQGHRTPLTHEMHRAWPGDYHSLSLTRIQFHLSKVTRLTSIAEVTLGLAIIRVCARGLGLINVHIMIMYVLFFSFLFRCVSLMFIISDLLKSENEELRWAWVLIAHYACSKLIKFMSVGTDIKHFYILITLHRKRKTGNEEKNLARNGATLASNKDRLVALQLRLQLELLIK